MSGHYKIAWLCEALLVSRSGYYAWIKRRRFPGPRQLENMRLRERIREEFVRSRQTYGSPRLAQVLGCPERRNRIRPAHAPGANLRSATIQISSVHERQPARRPNCS